MPNNDEIYYALTEETPPSLTRLMTTFVTMMPPLAGHEQRAMNAESSRMDDTHAEVISRWSIGRISPAELDRMGSRGNGCSCAACIRSAYEAVEEGVGTRPLGYGPSCRCTPCMEWRRRMAVGIQGVIVGSHARLNRRLTGHGGRSDPWPGMHDDLPPSLRVAAPDVTAFARQRERRGHPLPPVKLAADWQPNDWEA